LYITSIYSARTRQFVSNLNLHISPEWSPNGSEIAYAASERGNVDIYIANVNGQEKRRITFAREIDASPSWSPNGEEVVFMSRRSGKPQIYLIDRAGANLRRLTYKGKSNESPSWSPKGFIFGKPVPAISNSILPIPALAHNIANNKNNLALINQHP